MDQEDNRLELSKKIKIAIDGPAGAGKSTVARMVANQLDYIYVDTGAMYRAVTWFVLDRGLRCDDTGNIVDALRDISIELKPSKEGQQVWVNGREVTGMIRSPEVTGHVSQIAQIAEVRLLLTTIQQKLSQGGGIVMDGRDIGTKVLPEAELKIYLTATVEERAARRYREMEAAGMEVSLEQLQHDIAKRDRMDQEREVSPLRQAADAVYLDCTALSIEQVVERIVQLSLPIINGAVE